MLGCLMYSLNPLLLKEKFYKFDIPLNADLLQLGCNFIPGESMSLPLFPALMLSFYPLLWRLRSFNFWVLYRENYFIYSCRFVVLMSGGEYMILLCCHLEPPSDILMASPRRLAMLKPGTWLGKLEMGTSGQSTALWLCRSPKTSEFTELAYLSLVRALTSH